MLLTHLGSTSEKSSKSREEAGEEHKDHVVHHKKVKIPKLGAYGEEKALLMDPSRFLPYRRHSPLKEFQSQVRGNGKGWWWVGHCSKELTWNTPPPTWTGKRVLHSPGTQTMVVEAFHWLMLPSWNLLIACVGK